MKRILAAIGVVLLLTACANVENSPSYLGMATLSLASESDDLDEPGSTQPHDALRHVTSNKVLGAMAFQKVTGAEVDPTTLIGRRSP